jgi:transposase
MAESSTICAGCVERDRRIDRLERIAEEQSKKIRDLEARLNLSSKNSSKPPSSDPPWIPKSSTNPTGRKPGGQPGHKGHGRAEFRAEEVDQRVEIEPKSCESCNRSLVGTRCGEADVRQVVEIPAVAAEVTEYTLGSRLCPDCGHNTIASLPEGIEGAIGRRFQAMLALFVGRFRLSRREAREAALAFFGPKARVSVGWISALEGRTSAALLPEYTKIESEVRSSKVVNADETSWPQRREMAWLWNASTPDASLYRIHRRRSLRAFRKLLGSSFGGTLVSDRWLVYRVHGTRRRQICWAHLKRNFQELVDRGGPSVRVGEEGLAIVRELFDATHARARDRTMLSTLARRIAPLRVWMRWVVRRGTANADLRASQLCKDLLKFFPALWTFARIDGVPLTNNLAERRLRPAVLWRKNAFGSHSAAGSRFAERMMTVVQTLRLRGREILQSLELALAATRV